MVEKIEKLNEETILSALNIPSKVVVLNETTSTNDIAKRLIADGAPHGSVVVANEQTAGRGRRGRSFFSPADSGVYFSVILEPNISPEESVLLTSATAVCVCKVIKSLTNKNPIIKWLNDIYLNDRKCVGILVEGVFDGNGKWKVVVGIGVNVTTVDFPDEILTKAGSVGALSRNELVSAVVNELTSATDKLSLKEFLPEYKKLCFVLGKEIEVQSSNQSYTAIAVDIDDFARLIVEKDGKKITLYSEEVSVMIK